MSKPQDTGTWTPDSINIREPSIGERLLGWAKGQRPPNQLFNWMWNGVLSWTNWLSNLNIDQATQLSSWDINKGTGVVNSGINTTTINCSGLTIDTNSSKGKVSDSSSLDIIATTNFNIENATGLDFKADATSLLTVKNSSVMEIGIVGEDSSNINILNCGYGTIAGTRLDAEQSVGFTLKGDQNSIKNCENVVISSAISKSSAEGISNFTETQSNTKTIQNLRILGSKILKKVFDSEFVYTLGNTNQKLFGNRYLSQQAELYWHREVGDWRQSNLLLANVAIIGGQQSTDGLFATSVELIDADDTIEYPIYPSYDESENQTFSFWSKLNVVDWYGNNGVCYDYSYGDVGTTFGWAIARSLTTGFTFSVKNSNTLYENFLVGIPIKEDVFQYICVVFNFTEKSYSLYIDSEFIGTLYADSIIGAGVIPLALKIGKVGTETSPIAVKISDVTLWANRMLSPLDIQQRYAGGLELAAATPALFDNAKITAIQKYATQEICIPEYLGVNDNLFVSLKFPDWMKNDNNLSTTTVDIYSEKYILEDF